MRLRIVLLSVLLLLPALLVHAAQPRATTAPRGYLFNLSVDQGRVTMRGATLLPRFEALQTLPAAGAWQVQLLAADGQVLWTGQVPAPHNIALGMPHGQPLPIALRVPLRANAARLRLRDRSGATRFSVALDRAFAQQARDNRQQLLQALQPEARVAALSGAAQSHVVAYLAAQKDSAVPRRARRLVRPHDCVAAGMRYVPERVASGRPCVLPMPREASTRPQGRRSALRPAFSLGASDGGDGVPTVAGHPAGQQSAAASAPGTVTVSGQVLRKPGGDAIPEGKIQVLDSHNRVLHARPVWGGNFSLVLNPETWYVLEAGPKEETWPEPILFYSGSKDSTLEMYAPQRYPLTVTAKGPEGEPMDNGYVEIWQDGSYVIGSATEDDGELELTLPAGDYVARVRPSLTGFQGEDSITLYLADHGMAATAFSVPDVDALSVQMSADDMVKMQVKAVELPGTDRVDLFGRHFELLSPQGRVLAATYNDGSYITTARNGQDARTLSADLVVPAGGRYRLRIVTPGFPPRTSAVFSATEGGVVDQGLDAITRSWRWSGILRDADGTPLPSTYISIYDPTQIYIIRWSTGPQGNFGIPACTGCTYVFHVPVEGRTYRRIETLGNVTGSFTRDVTLKNLTGLKPQVVQDGSLQLLYGAEDGTYFDILFIGEGYTAGNESFTDSNGNGVWDGVLYHDSNQDGVWNTDEPYARYGNAGAPTDGEDPSLGNEPFNDANGDGALNIGEAQVFFKDARDYMRALLANGYWHKHREAFRAWTYLKFSAQAGVDIEVPDDGKIIDRNTLLNATVNTERDLMSVDYAKANQIAATKLPSYDAIVVLINEPIPYGRANSFILAQGGLLTGSPNSKVPSHEFGHKVGWLGDEYPELGGVKHERGWTEAPDMTRSLVLGKVPWRAWLPANFDNSQPTAPYVSGAGIFQSGSQVGGGVYRSVFESKMRHNAPLFSRYQKFLMNGRLEAMGIDPGPGMAMSHTVVY